MRTMLLSGTGDTVESMASDDTRPVIRLKLGNGIYAVAAESASATARDAVRAEVRRLGDQIWGQADAQRAGHGHKRAAVQPVKRRALRAR
jgi:hypothetical protein